jgi:pimeloyl-ACP methyl ester carboxylesterase
MNIDHTTDQVFVRSNGIQIQYHQHPTSTIQPRVIFLHGIGIDLNAYDDIRQQLALNDISSLAVDLRGHGFSSRPKNISAYTIEEISEDIVDFLKEKKFDRPILFGHSLGGMVAQKVASQYPKLDGLILLNTAYTSQMPFKSLLARCTMALARISPRLYVRKKANYKAFLRSHDFSLRRYISEISHTSLKSYFAMFANIQRLDSRNVLKDIHTPTLIIAGSKDPIFSVHMSQYLHEHIQDSKMQIIKGGNHSILFDPDFTRTLIEYIVNFVNQLTN